MRALSLALCMVSQVMFPLPKGRTDVPSVSGAARSLDQSTIEGSVKTREGVPIPVANVSVATQQDTTRADQRGEGVGWPGAVTKVRRDGSFRVTVPGGTTYSVCAEVPAKPKQCRLVDVSENDVQVVRFAF